MKRQQSNVFVIRTLTALALATTLALVLVLVFTPQLKTLFGVPAPIPGDDWPTYLHDFQRTSASGEVVLSSSNAAQLAKLWSFRTRGGIAASPAVVDGTAYIGSWDGYEYALDMVKGFLKWKTYLGITIAPACIPVKLGITSSATVQNNILYVGGGDSYWYALDARTGAVLWKVFTGNNSADKGNYNWSSPLIYKNYAYIGLASNCDNPLVPGELLKLDLMTHKVVNTFKVVGEGEVGGGIWTSPTLDTKTNTIYVTTGTQNISSQKLSQAIIALDATTLTLEGAWQIPPAQSGVDSDWGNTPVLFTDAAGHQMVAATNKNGFTYAFDRADIGKGPLWEQQIAFGGACPPCGEGSISSGTFANGLLYMAGGNTTINNVGYPGSVRALDPATGKFLWEHGDSHPVIPALAYANGLIIDAAGPTLEVLNAATGERLYSYETGEGVDGIAAGLYGAPSISHGEIFIGALDGKVYAFGLSKDVSFTSDSNCPSSWSCQDLGNSGLSSSETLSGGTWSVTTGGLGIGSLSGGTTDQFHFIARSARGDIQIATQVVSQQVVSPTAQAGLMVRQSMNKGSPFYAALFTSKNQFVVQYRTAFNGGILITSTLTTLTQPHYLEIQRIGDQFRSATSIDGIAYTLVPGSTITLDMPTKVLEGLAISSGVKGTTGTASFRDVTIGTPNVVPATPGSATSCPNGWNCRDIGNPLLVGDQSLKHGTWTVQGAGRDIWDTSDQFHFIWRSLEGDGAISAHIVAQANTAPLAKAGIMLRASTDAASPYYAVFVTPGQGLNLQYRMTRGLHAQLIASGGKVPIYLRVVRWNNIFTTYTSEDGMNWKPVDGSSITINISGSMLAGLTVTSHDVKTLDNVNFDGVSLTKAAIPPPTVCPLSWNCADIGYPAPKGNQIFHNGTWILQGGGFDIFFKADQFHYVWRSLTGDGAVSARVITETGVNFSQWAKAGVMLRQNKDPGSPYYAVLVTPKRGVIVQYRLSQGAATGENLLPETEGVPIYLKVDRSNNIFTAYTSRDGFAWKPIAGSSIVMNINGPLLGGLAVTSTESGILSVATFDAVSFQPY